MKILGVSGHRAEKLGGYTPEAADVLRGVARAELEKLKPDRVITGMALGFDMAVAWACNDLGIPYTAAVAFPGQPKRWNPTDRALFDRLCERATERVVVSPHAAPRMEAILSALQRRNRWIVDHCDQMLICWDGRKEGGTYHAKIYADRVKRPIVGNCYSEWESRHKAA